MDPVCRNTVFKSRVKLFLRHGAAGEQNSMKNFLMAIGAAMIALGAALRALQSRIDALRGLGARATETDVYKELDKPVDAAFRGKK